MMCPIVISGLLLAQSVSAQPPSGPAEAASAIPVIESTLRPGEKITLRLTDGGSIKGRYIYISRLDSALFLAFERVTVTTDTSVSLAQIRKITYKRAGRPQLAYAIGGLVLGTALGHLAERVIFDPGASPGMFHKYTSRGSFWGGMSGLVLGTVISTAVPSPRTLDLPER